MISISLFFLCGFLALLLIYLSNKVSNKEKRKKAITFAFSCMIASIIFCYFYLFDHWHVLRTSAANLFAETEINHEPRFIPTQQVYVAAKELKPLQTVQLEAPLFEQLPELPRGCELTSLSMLLAYHDIDADKMLLAENVKQNPATMERRDGKTYFGHPNNGFVGDILSLTTPGLGVYHKPIAELAEQFASDLTVKDFSGENFTTIIEQLQLGRPVWVIINAWYQELPESEFITWHTEDGPIDITYREHSVLITGYDEEYIYFNDPLDYTDKAPRKDFEKAWVQMGKQAITIY